MTKQGHELQFGVNHLSHFLLFEMLRASMLASTTEEFTSRVTVVSSCAYRNRGIAQDSDYNFRKDTYEPNIAYGQSKTANVYTANDIERRFGAQGLHGLSVHPGVIVEAGIVRHLTDDYKKLVAMFGENPTFEPQSKNSAQGAGCIVWASVADVLNGREGLFLEDCREGQSVKEVHSGGILARAAGAIIKQQRRN